MDILSIIAAFGGGVIGAYLGAVPAFIMTGLFALIGSAALAMGVDGSFMQGTMAFGVFLSPAVSFAGGVAAAAYAGKKGKLASGTDVISALNGLSAGDVLAVGGIAGIIGWLLQNVVSFFPTAIKGMDAPGFGVVILGILARFAFGKTGLVGKYENGEQRQFITGKALSANLVLGLGLGLVIGVIYSGASDLVRSNLPVICFGFSATTLAFTCMGLAVPSTHHITLPAASGAALVCGLAGGSVAGAVIGGIIFGVAGSLLGDFYGNTVNSHVDTHIDPPACTIVTLTLIISIISTIAG